MNFGKRIGAADNGVDLQQHFCGTRGIPKTSELPGQTLNETDSQVKYRRAETWFRATGGALPSSLTDSWNGSALLVSSQGCRK